MPLEDHSAQIVKLLSTGLTFIPWTIIVTIMPPSFFDLRRVAFRAFHLIRPAQVKHDIAAFRIIYQLLHVHHALILSIFTSLKHVKNLCPIQWY